MEYFRLTELGKKLFGWEKEMDGRRMHWAKLPLDLFSNPVFLGLPDSQKLPFIGVGLLCVRHNNSLLLGSVDGLRGSVGGLLTSVNGLRVSANSLRRSLNLRTKPDLALYMDLGLMEADAASRSSHSLDKTRQEQKRTEEKRTPLPPKGGDSAHEVFDYWTAVMGKPKSKFTSDKRRKVEARLREGFTVADLRQAVDGCRASPYHRGENDAGTVYDSLTLICRNGTKVEEFKARAPRNPPARAAPENPWHKRAEELARTFSAWLKVNQQDGELPGLAFYRWLEQSGIPESDRESAAMAVSIELKRSRKANEQTGVA